VGGGPVKVCERRPDLDQAGDSERAPRTDGSITSKGGAPKTLLENSRLAAVTSAELGERELRKVTGRDLDAFYDRLRRRGLSARSVRRYHAVLSAALNQAVRCGLLQHSPVAQATPPALERIEAPPPSPEQIKASDRDGADE
jgi:hypothetical protein